MIPIIVPSFIAKKEADCCLCWSHTNGGQRGSNNLVSSGTIQFMMMLMFGRPDFLKPALCDHV